MRGSLRLVVTLTVPRPHRREAGRFWQAKCEIHALHRGAGRPLGQVVQNGDGDQPACIVINCDLDVNRIRSEH